MRLTEDMIRYPLTDEAGVSRPRDIIEAAFRERELRQSKADLDAMRRTRNTLAILALCGWVLAFVLLAGVRP